MDSLKEVNPQQATKLSNDFNALVRAASHNSVREKVADPTRLGIDSMYQFKSIKLCADIQKTLIDSRYSVVKANNHEQSRHADLNAPLLMLVAALALSTLHRLRRAGLS